MRKLALIAPLLLVTGCGTSSSAAKPTSTSLPKPTAQTEPGAKFTKAPPMQIDVHHSYKAVVTTSDGTFVATLLPKVAPITVNNFVFLARHHYCDGNPFHRIISTFMVQTGDPTGTGFGGPGYHIKDEPVRLPYRAGVLAMANSGQPNTGGSQFFIVTGNQGATLAPTYTIFGRVTSGMGVIKKIANTPVTTSPSGEVSQPLKEVVMKTVRVQESS